MQKICYGCMKKYDSALDACPYCHLPSKVKQPEPSHIEAGTMLKNRYIVGIVIGYGGFGVTYVGYDTTLSRKVAIKEYMPGEFATRMPPQTRLTVYSGDKEEQFSAGKKKFVDESRQMAKFQNIPEIVHVFDFFEENGTAYIVMEYLNIKL